jgi:threonine/homoserine/homoserine lactone efflux protein
MHISSALLGGLLLGFFMAISVGPTLFAILRYSLNHSYKAGLAFVFGVSISDLLFVSIANIATPILEWFHHYSKLLSYCAAILLIIVGAVGFIKKHKPKKPKIGLISVSRSQYFRIWLTGFLINTINPALALQWILAATGLAKENTIIRITFFGSCLALVLSIDLLKVYLADAIRRKLTLRRIMYLQRISALCILIFGVVLLALTILHIEFKPPSTR